MTLGIFFPIEAFAGDQPKMQGQERLAQRAEALGFAALWFRDVPLRVPRFGDVGQGYDVFVYLAWIAACTRTIALATGAVILPLRHPLHTAKAAASLDRLSGGRLVLGVASGDRPEEFPAFGVESDDRGGAFREHLLTLRSALHDEFPRYRSERLGHLDGSVGIVPRPLSARLPSLVIGSSRQELDWIATDADGWFGYPDAPQAQANRIAAWRTATIKGGSVDPKPFGQSLYVDISDDAVEQPTPIHLGFRSGREYLRRHLQALEAAGVAHVVLNLKYGRRPAEDVLEEIGAEVVPHFPIGSTVQSGGFPLIIGNGDLS